MSDDMRGLDHWIEDQQRIRAGISREDYWGTKDLDAFSHPTEAEMMEFNFGDEMRRRKENEKEVRWKDGDKITHRKTGEVAVAVQTEPLYRTVAVDVFPDAPGEEGRAEFWDFADILTPEDENALREKARRWEEEGRL